MSVRQLRIAMLSVHSCPMGNLGAKDTGGMNVCIRELARELGQQGYFVDVYTRIHDPRDARMESLGEGARLIHLRAGGDEEINKLALYPYLPDFAADLENFRENNDLHYDLVFSHYWLSAWVGQYLQGWWAVPHIITFHTLGAVKNTIGVGGDEPELRLKTEREVGRNCQRIIATTEREKEALIQYYGAVPEKIGVVPCGVNLELFQPQDKEMARRKLGFGDEKIILFVGRIEPLKGIDQLLRAISLLPSSQGLKLMIIGGDETSQYEMERLQKLAGELRIKDSVSFLGLVKHEQMPYFYNAADVCLIPSYYESFALVALESLACGTPLVATDVGDLKNIIRQGKTGYVVKDNAPPHLADKINLLLAQPRPDARSLRDSVLRFSWSNIAEMMTKEITERILSSVVS